VEIEIFVNDSFKAEVHIDTVLDELVGALNGPIENRQRFGMLAGAALKALENAPDELIKAMPDNVATSVVERLLAVSERYSRVTSK
jgi:hypothetical protein